MACSGCGKPKVLARGLCSNCYYKQRKAGALPLVNIPRVGRVCSVEGCNRAIDAKNLCSMHYAKRQDNRRNTWKLIRSRYPGEFPPSWKFFEAFCADVGERPSLRHQFRRLDTSKPFSRENVHWLPPVGEAVKQAPEYSRAWKYGKHYHISLADYEAMLAKQGGVCAICKKVETVTVRKKVRELCVDHDHETGKVRGLLCARCNRGIGYLGDDADRLRSAIAYLDQSKPIKPATAG